MKVKFVPQNVEFEIKPGQSVLHLAQDHQIHIKSVCRGVPSCAECRVRVVEGEHNVIPPGSAELGLIGTAWFVDRRRLSCQLRCFGDITVDLTEQVEKEGSAKKPRGRYNKDELQESRAVLGNLVMGDEDPGALKEESPTRSASAQNPTAGGVRAGEDGEDAELDKDALGADESAGDDGAADDGDGDEESGPQAGPSRSGEGGPGVGAGGGKKRRRRGRRGGRRNKPQSPQ